MKTSINSLDAVVNKILQDFMDDVELANRVSVDDVAESCVSQLKGTSPKNKGSYARTWTYETNKSLGKYGATIFNKKNYRLTHLLEKGHDLVDKNGKKIGKGRTQAYPHIAPAEQQAIEKYETELKRKINGIK